MRKLIASTTIAIAVALATAPAVAAAAAAAANHSVRAASFDDSPDIYYHA